MDKFDQWYNKKMDEQDIVYPDNAWESFSQQLEKLPAKNKRRFPLFFWWVLGLSFIIEGGVLWYYLSSDEIKQEALIKSGSPSDELQLKERKSQEPQDLNSSSQPLATNSIRAEDIDKSLLRSEISNQHAAQNVSSAETNASNTGSSKLTARKIGNNKAGKTPGSNIAQSIENQTNSEQTMNTFNNELVLAGHNAEESEKIRNTELKDMKLNNPEGSVIKSDEVLVLVSEIKPIEGHSAIELPVTQLQAAESVSIKPQPYQVWTHHAEIGAQFFPGIKEGSRFLTGLSAAYHLQYNWAKRWSVSLGIGALQRWGSFGGFEDSPQDRYASTKIRRGYLLVPTAATYMQIPLMFNFQQGRHVFSAGVRSMVLMGVKGQLEEYSVQRDAQQESLVVNTSKVNTGWINESGFRSIVPEYLLAYGFQVNRHFSASVSLGWMPNGIVYADKGNDFADVVFNATALDSNNSQQPFLLENKWQLGLGLKYKF